MTYDDIVEQTEAFQKLLHIIMDLYNRIEALQVEVNELRGGQDTKIHELEYRLDGHMVYLDDEAIRARQFRREVIDVLQRYT